MRNTERGVLQVGLMRVHRGSRISQVLVTSHIWILRDAAHLELPCEPRSAGRDMPVHRLSVSQTRVFVRPKGVRMRTSAAQKAAVTRKRRTSMRSAATGTGIPAVIPMISYEDGIAALEWLRSAFGFRETARVTTPDGKLSHDEMEAGTDSTFRTG